MNYKLEALERRLEWIAEGMGNIEDMPTYNVVSDIKEALDDIIEILKEL